MSPALFIPLPGNEAIAKSLATALRGELGAMELRSFPDGEVYLRLLSGMADRSVAIVCTLARPNDKILTLMFAAATARELGAGRPGLVAPYLAYMRQDRRFKPGEAVTSREIARLLSSSFDWMVTVDPHLHRYKSLADIYTIPTQAVHAAPLMSSWIRNNVAYPVIIGPDSESEQWVAAVAHEAEAPYTVLEKTRRGDRDVEIRIRNLEDIGERTPIFVDDIVSTGRTMMEAVRIVRRTGATKPVCIAVHGLFADRSDDALINEGAEVVTSNTVSHATNRIDVAPLLANAVKQVLEDTSNGLQLPPR